MPESKKRGSMNPIAQETTTKYMVTRMEMTALHLGMLWDALKDIPARSAQYQLSSSVQ